MKENSEIKVILSKVGWCGHCTDFLPIFNQSKNLIKDNKILKNVKVDFEVYDMEQDKGIFETKYGELVDKIEGYPTVFLTQVKNDKISKTVEIGHAQKSVDFIKLISDAYKSFSNQTGGNLEDDIYKQKYLKYKSKYILLKTQFGGDSRFKLIIKRKIESGHHFSDYSYNYFIIDLHKPDDIYTFEQNELFTYPDIVGFHTTGGLFHWPINLDSGGVENTSRDNNYKYQQKHIEKFTDNIDQKNKDDKESFPKDYVKVIEFSFD